MTRMPGSALKSSSLVCSRANLRRCRWPGNSDHFDFPSDAGDRQEDAEEQELPVENKQSLLPEPERDLGQVGRGGEVGGGERWAAKRKEKKRWRTCCTWSETAPPWWGEASPVCGEGRPTAGECCKVTFPLSLLQMNIKQEFDIKAFVLFERRQYWHLLEADIRLHGAIRFKSNKTDCKVRTLKKITVLFGNFSQLADPPPHPPLLGTPYSKKIYRLFCILDP